MCWRALPPRLGMGPDTAAAGPGLGVAGRVRCGRAVGAAAAGARAAWRARSLVARVLVMFGATGILVGTFFLNSLYLQDVQHASPLRVGLEFLPLALVIGAGAHLASRLLPRAGSRR